MQRPFEAEMRSRVLQAAGSLSLRARVEASVSSEFRLDPTRLGTIGATGGRDICIHRSLEDEEVADLQPV